MTNFATREEALSALWKEREKFEQDDRLEEFEELEKKIKMAPVLNLSVAIDFSSGEISEILEKSREMFNKELFLNVRVDPGLIGGCVVIWNGVVQDYSLKKTIGDKHGEFRKLLEEKWK